MPSLKTKNAVINFETSSEKVGPWVTLINGHTRSMKDFKILTKTLEESGFRVLTMDNRGAGESTYSAPFTLPDLCEDIVALWQHCQITKTHLLGISMGGMISQNLAATYPNEIDRLVLISTTADRSFVDLKAEAEWGETLDSVKAKLANYFSERFLERNKLLVDAMAKQILKQIQDGSFGASSQAQREAMASFNGTAFLPHIKAETLVIHGAKDRIIAPKAAKELAQSIPQARLQMIEGAGHLLLAEAPRELYAIVADFFLGKDR